MRPASNLPTDAELEILTILWARGPSTVREVHDELSKGKAIGYTSVLKVMQIMHEKGYVARNTSARSHVYHAIVGRERTQTALVDHLLERAFGGSASQLVQRALSGRRASPEEIAQIRALLDELPDAGGDT